MKILDRYIRKSVIFSTLFVVFVLVGFQIFISFFQELHDLGTGNYTFLLMIQYVFLMLPANVYQFFPMAGLIGSLIGLGYLASNHELVVMRASGVSIFRIIFSVIKAAIIMIFFAVLIGEVIAPRSNQIANQLKANAEMQDEAVNTLNGVWLHQNNRFIRIDKVLTSDRLLGITEYITAPNNQISAIQYAESASNVDGKWQLNDVAGTRFNQQKSVSSYTEKTQPWSVQFKPNLVRLLQADPESLSLKKAYDLIQYREKNKLSTSDLTLSFWQRIIQPFSILVLICLGAPIIFGPLRQVSMGSRFLMGIGVGFSFFLMNRFFGPISVYYQVSPLIGASLPLIIFLAFGLWMLSRVR